MKTLLAILLSSIVTFAQVSTVGPVKTVGGVVSTVSNGPSNSSLAHGIYVAFPSLYNASGGSRWQLYTVHLFDGTATISSSIKGAFQEAHWGSNVAGQSIAASGPTTINSTASTSYPTYSYTDPDARADNVYTCHGACSGHKTTGWGVESASYSDASAGNVNVGIPTWYSAMANITAISRSGNIIHVTVSSTSMLTGLLVGANPSAGCLFGTSPAPDGVTKCFQVFNASPSDLNGVFAICDSRTPGCVNPTSTDLYLISPISGNESGTVTSGTCSATGTATCGMNPMMDLLAPSGGTADLCSEGGVHVPWSTNFTDAYDNFLLNFVTHTSSGTPGLETDYYRIGFSFTGFENFPSSNNGPTGSYAGGVPTNCRGMLNTWGYGGGAAFTALTFGNGGADPTGLNTGEPPANGSGADCTSSGATGGCVFWNNTYLLPQFQWMKANLRPLTAKYLSIGLSLTTYGSPDVTAPELMAKNALSNGIGLGSAGLRQADLAYTGATQTIDNNSNFVFNAHRGFGFNYQTTQSSDPTGILVEPGPNTSASTGPLTTLLPFAATQGGQQLEPITIDAECTESGFDGGVYGTAGTAHPATMTETGSVVTATQSSGTVTADFIAGSTTTFVTGFTGAASGYNGSWPVTATGPCTGCASGGGNLSSAQIQFTDTNTGLGSGSGGTFANDYEIYANCSAAGYPALFTAIGALLN